MSSMKIPFNVQGRRLISQPPITRAVAEATAARFGITLHRGIGVIGALGAVALACWIRHGTSRNCSRKKYFL